MKNQATPSFNLFVILPEVMLAWVYLLCVHLWTVWQVMNFKMPIGEDSPIRFMTGQAYTVLSVCNLLFFCALLFGGNRARKSPPSLQKGHYASVILGVITMLLLQWASHRLYGPIVVL